MPKNKIVYNGDPLIDLTSDTVTSAHVLSGDKFHDKTGTVITGTMPNNGAINPTALNAGGSYTIPAGYHNGSGKVTGNSLASQTSADAEASDILSPKTAWVNGSKVTGTMVEQDEYMTTLSSGSEMTVGSTSRDNTVLKKKISSRAVIKNGGTITINMNNGILANAFGISATKIVSGNTILGIAGTAALASKAELTSTVYAGGWFQTNLNTYIPINGNWTICAIISWIEGATNNYGYYGITFLMKYNDSSSGYKVISGCTNRVASNSTATVYALFNSSSYYNNNTNLLTSMQMVALTPINTNSSNQYTSWPTSSYIYSVRVGSTGQSFPVHTEIYTV